MYTSLLRILIISLLIISVVRSQVPWSQFRSSYDSIVGHQNQTSSSIDADVSKEYIRWSEWHHRQLEQALNRRTLPIPNPSSSSSIEPTTTTTSTTTTLEESSLSTSVYMESVLTTASVTLPDWNTTMSTWPNSTLDNMSSVTDSGFTYTTGVTVLLATLTVITSFITVSGNLLVLLSFFVERALRTATNYFIASLAVTDLLIGIFSMNFYTLYLILGHWPLGRLSCDLWLSLDYTACLTSQYTVLIITIDRFCSVRLPAKYRNWRTDRKVFIMVAATWIIPSSVFFPTIMAWPYFKTDVIPRPSNECYAEFANDPIFNTVFTLCYFWVTLCVMIGLYVGIYKVAVNLQKRSDEKRNRVSGLISNSTHRPGSGKDGTNQSKQNRQQQQKQQQELQQQQLLRKNNQSNLPSSSAAGESSGFDSDEEQQRKLEAKQPQVPNNPNTKGGTSNFQSIIPTVGPTNGTGPRATTNTLTTQITVQPALLEQDGKFDLPVFERKPKKAVVVKPTAGPKFQCPIHGRPSIISLNGQGDYYRYSPASVTIYQAEGLQISSPLLTDEDSGFDANGINGTQPRPNYMPCSPALCICSDLEEEQQAKTTQKTENDQPPKLPNRPPEKSTGPVLPVNKANPTPSPVKPPTPTQGSPKSDPPTRDNDYQDRVMENFRRRMAAIKGLPTSESHDSDYLTSSNPSSQQPSVNRSNENAANKRVTEPDRKPDMPRTPACNNAVTLTPQHHYSDTGTGDSEMESTPLWVPQTMRMGHQLSASGSIRDMSCCYSHANLNYYVDQPECLICAGQQQESDTLQSSSSYADYVETGLESGQCFCQLNHQEPKQASWWEQLRNKLRQIPFSKTHWIIIHRIQASFAKTKEKSKKVPVERGRRENRARKALRTITFILGAFVLCWTPYHVVIMIKGICDDVVRKYTCVNEILYSVTYWLCYMNSPINPFCYALANAQFKKTFLRIFHGDFRRI